MGKLLIIRGAPGCGKTSVANYLHNFGDANTVLLPKDVFAIDFIKDNRELYKPMYDALEAAATTFLQVKDAFVIIEGAMYKQHWFDLIARLGDTAQEVHIFYLDVSVEVAVQRAMSRNKAHIVTEEHIREDYPGSKPMGVINERIISVDTLSPNEIAQSIAKDIRLPINTTLEKAQFYSESFQPNW